MSRLERGNYKFDREHWIFHFSFFLQFCKKIGYVQTEYTFDLGYADRYSLGKIFTIPIIFGDCTIPYPKI